MSAGGSAMVRGSAISSNKGAPTDENAFTEQGDSLNYPKNYHDALKNTETILRLTDKGEVKEDVLDTLDWGKPLNFQDSYEKTSLSKQTAEATCLTGGTVITVIGQSIGEFVYEVRTEGDIVNLFEYKIVKDTRDNKLDELAYNYTQSRKRKLMSLDRDIVRQI